MIAAVLVLGTAARTVVRDVVRDVVTVAGGVVGAAVAVATAAGSSGAFDVYRFSLANSVMPPKLLSVIAVASVRSTTVETTSGLGARRVRSAMPDR